MIKKRHMILTEEILKKNTHMCDPCAISLDTRQDILTVEIPKLGKEAASKAIEEWGQPKSKITHVIFSTSNGIHMPGADYQLVKLLGLEPSVERLMLYYQGCHAGGAVLRLAKDIAENNRGARVLAVCADSIVIAFRGPIETQLDSLVGPALFGDGAGAVIVGADPDESIEGPIFQLVWASQTTVPDTEDAILAPLREVGMPLRLRKGIHELLSNTLENVLDKAFYQVKIDDWNSIFWVVHPGGPAILNEVEAKLEVSKNKLLTSRYVLSEFGNMISASVLFILDEMRNRSLNQRKETTGEGLEWGVLLGFGPGLTIETVLLHSVSINH